MPKTPIKLHKITHCQSCKKQAVVCAGIPYETEKGAGMVKLCAECLREALKIIDIISLRGIRQ